MSAADGARPAGEELSFEEAFLRLEETVSALERGGLTLEDSLRLYEEGMRLTLVCSHRLDSAELRITELGEQMALQMDASGTPVPRTAPDPSRSAPPQEGRAGRRG